jgi:hypothetical protein
VKLREGVKVLRMLKIIHLGMDHGILFLSIHSHDYHVKEEDENFDVAGEVERMTHQGKHLEKEDFETIQSLQCFSQFSAWLRS